MWGVVGSCGELWGVVGRCGELWGVVGRRGELWGVVGRIEGVLKYTSMSYHKNKTHSYVIMIE